ncbi:hypothetical protein E4T66_17130 [Sinimarinibacterium sp. CAU 1509]|uniref:hypothetical protein n=1 Tax=Sinimarinibacterium sp. CAU 1509 TaxID=2562283 RepID=UPI0010AD77F5|nr:hypothetical protein [Sinimarinibacterium sp. CAU 1509]TJY57134.1 hypothetical protein E4T66_17130 [Sinimarinibacterium sp. CAU 1509]
MTPQATPTDSVFAPDETELYPCALLGGYFGITSDGDILGCPMLDDGRADLNDISPLDEQQGADPADIKAVKAFVAGLQARTPPPQPTALIDAAKAVLQDILDAAAFNKEQGFHDIAAERKGRHAQLLAAIDELESEELSAAALLVHAYSAGRANGESVDWEDVDRAWQVARRELGAARCADIATLYPSDDGDGA